MTYDEILKLYKGYVAQWPDQKVKGRANKYTSLNGNMFSFLDKTPMLCLRLSKEDEAAFNDEYGTENVLQYGSVMRGYVGVPDSLIGTDGLTPWLAKCWENAKSLKPKPTKK